MKDKYGRWTVETHENIKRDGRVYWSCVCECGTRKDVIVKNLKSGVSTSCGCKGKEMLLKRNTKHGKRFTKTWRAWQAMKNRCYNKNFTQYENYGGRGIRVCDEWRHDFMAFYNYVGEAPDGKTLDRINTNGNYEPDNVRWATAKEQGRNKTNTRKINGVCISEISKKLGGRHSLVAKRIRRGWSIDRAITEQTHAK